MDVLDLSADFASVDGLQEMTLTGRDSGSVEVVTALRRRVTEREAAKSNGRYLASDTAIHFSAASLAFNPVEGDTLTDDQLSSEVETWTILEASRDTLLTRWRCICRKLKISEVASTLITIESASWAKAADGSQVATWSTLASSVRASRQRVSSENDEQQNRHEMKRVTEFTLQTQLIIERGHRITDSDSNVYRVTGWRDADQLGDLITIECEDWPV